MQFFSVVVSISRLKIKNIILFIFILPAPLLWSQGYYIHQYTLLSSSVDAQSETYHIKGGLAEWNCEVSYSKSYLIDSGFWGSIYQKLFARNQDLLLPDEFSVSSAYPNPFNPITILDFALPTISDVRITIYNILGKEVFRYDQHSLKAGHYQFKWQGRNLKGKLVPSGVYIITLTSDKKRFTRKVTFIK